MPEESATPDLVELGRQTFGAWSSGDFDRALSFYAPDAVWDGSTVSGLVTKGHAAIRESMEALRGPYEVMDGTLEDATDLGSGVTFGVTVLKGRLRGSSGGQLQMRSGVVVEWTDGLITRATFYADIDQARAAAERLAEERG